MVKVKEQNLYEYILFRHNLVLVYCILTILEIHITEGIVNLFKNMVDQHKFMKNNIVNILT